MSHEESPEVPYLVVKGHKYVSKARYDALLKLFARYGRHQANCASTCGCRTYEHDHSKCTCGFESKEIV